MADSNKLDETALTEEDSMLVAYLLVAEDFRQRNEKWNDFEKELKYNNRFYCNHPIVEEVHNRKNEATKIFPLNTVFYRARAFNKSGIDKIAIYLLQEYGMSKDEAKAAIAQLTDNEKWIALLSQMIYNNTSAGTTPLIETSAFIRAQEKWRRNIKFKGFNAEDSSAPPPDFVKMGRANPDYIRYLYLAEDNVTPIYEIRPIIGQKISIAKFKLLREIKVYDMTLDIKDTLSDNFKWPSLYNSIGNMFSRPYNGDASQYFPTQYLAEEIKKMGFDGLRFNSSLHSGGVNVVLFNPENCKAVSSDLVEVKGINIDFEQPLIYKIGDGFNGLTES